MADFWSVQDVNKRKADLYQEVIFYCENKLTIGDKVDWPYKYETDSVWVDCATDIADYLISVWGVQITQPSGTYYEIQAV